MTWLLSPEALKVYAACVGNFASVNCCVNVCSREHANTPPPKVCQSHMEVFFARLRAQLLLLRLSPADFPFNARDQAGGKSTAFVSTPAPTSWTYSFSFTVSLSFQRTWSLTCPDSQQFWKSLLACSNFNRESSFSIRLAHTDSMMVKVYASGLMSFWESSHSKVRKASSSASSRSSSCLVKAHA